MNPTEPNEPTGPSDRSSGESPQLVDSSGPSKTGGRQAGILFIWITLFIDILGIGIVIPVLPGLVKELLGAEQQNAPFYYGAIVASYATMQFLFAPILGGLSDRFGRRPILLGSMFGLGVDFIIQGLAGHIWLLFAARMISGIFGASFSTGNAYIADISTDETRARNFGLVGAAFGLGFIIGPALGGILAGFSLRVPFFAAAALALINWLYGYFILPESLPPEKRRPFSLRNANPLGSIATLKRYPFVAALAVVFLLKALAQRGLENVFVLYTEFKFAWTASSNGWFLCWVGVTAVIVQGGMVRPAVKRFGERKVLIVASVIGSIAFMGYALASAGWMLPVIAVVGALAGLAGPAVQSMVTKTVDETEQGEVQGALTSLQGLTSIAAPIVFTTGLFGYFTSDAAPVKFPGAPFALGSILIAIAAVIAIYVFRRFPEQVEAVESEEKE